MRIQPSQLTSVRSSSTTVSHTSMSSKIFAEHVRQRRTSPGARGSALPKNAMSSSPQTEGATQLAASGTRPSATTGASGGVTGSSSSAGAAGAPGSTSGSVESSLDQSEDQNIQFLQFQSQINDQSETFTTLSNVMKTENDTLKNTAGNMAM